MYRVSVIQESLLIPGTDLHLVYHSSRAGGYLSTIQLQLTPDSIPADLVLIHLRISIEGILFEKLFEADPAVKYTYAWNRRNVYRQKVYGVATATAQNFFHCLIASFGNGGFLLLFIAP
ncbi:teneurin-m [Trichonephila clavipes]|nr:teneurin-m [Trichonephila clavipes]